MAFLAGAASLRVPFILESSSRRRTVLPAAVKATPNSSSDSHHPLISSLRLAASAAVLLAATSPAIACTPSTHPPPPTLTVEASAEDPIPDGSHPFEKLIVETAALARFSGAEAARARLSAAGGGDHYDRLLAAQALFVDGKVDEAIAAFEELAREDPGDYRPLFCQGVLYSLMGREAEADSILARCREVAGDKFDPDYILAVPATAAAEAEFVAEKTEAEAEAGAEGEAEKL